MIVRPWIGRLARWVGTLLLGYFLIRRAEPASLIALLAGVDVRWLGLAIALYAIDRLTAAFKWQLLYATDGRQLPLLRALEYYLEAAFIGAVLPATVGMDVVRARLASLGRGSFAHAIGSIVVERIAGLASLLAAALLGSLILMRQLEWQPMGAHVAAGIAVGVAVIGVGYGAWRLGRAGRLRFRPRKVVFVEELSRSVRAYGNHPALVLAVFGIAFLQQIGLTVITWQLARALGISVSLGTMLWVWPIVMVGIRLPLSVLGFGVRELLLVALLASAGISASASVSLGLLSGALDLLFIAIGGVLVLVLPSPIGPRPRLAGTDVSISA